MKLPMYKSGHNKHYKNTDLILLSGVDHTVYILYNVQYIWLNYTVILKQ